MRVGLHLGSSGPSFLALMGNKSYRRECFDDRVHERVRKSKILSKDNFSSHLIQYEVLITLLYLPTIQDRVAGLSAFEECR